jgi:DNA-binding NarL/FixJ family response regulator
MYTEEHLLMEMVHAGVDGYLIKNAGALEILEAAKAVYKGENYYCSTTSLHLAKWIAEKRKNQTKKAQEPEFSEGERQVLLLLCEQFATKEIADKTRLTFKTVETYRHRIMNKIGARNTVGIVIYAIRHGLYNP